MWYKRYGFRHPTSNSGLGFFSGLAVTIIAMLVSLGLVDAFDSYWLLLAAVPVAIAGFELLSRRPGKERNVVREERYRYHIEQAYAGIEAGDNDAALESIRRIKIYGELPAELQAFETAAGRRR
ncbi:hypothetical protein [Microbulbifer sediminum]|uniref:hypothetical protein n=1 Tax=Microbulbifer sediminum TaxID=2904250 RepID=UPI001F34321B|nr:hypothetical protein [Microbulbifer sediminum]